MLLACFIYVCYTRVSTRACYSRVLTCVFYSRVLICVFYSFVFIRVFSLACIYCVSFCFSRGLKRKAIGRNGASTVHKRIDKFTTKVAKQSDGFLTSEEEQYWRDNFEIKKDNAEGN